MLTRPARLLALLCGLGVLFLCGGGCDARRDPLARIQESGVLRVATDPSFPPFEFVTAEGQMAGIDIELMQAFARCLDVDVHFSTTTYDGLYDALIAGQADVIASAIYPDPLRTQDFVFSTPYFDAGTVLVVPASSSIAEPVDLAGKQILVVFGTEGHMAAMDLEVSLTPAPEIDTVQSAEEALAALLRGEGDAVMVDHLAVQVALHRGEPLRSIEPALTHEPYVIAARKDESALIDAFDVCLEDMKRDGVFERLMSNWLK
ncbi:MAG: amino acid ABC transporter substrate-binding protein [Anaerolineae bacterium]|nr:amino acid ABC transporter substrate-binding protein [Anaerolineae bacterium]